MLIQFGGITGMRVWEGWPGALRIAANEYRRKKSVDLETARRQISLRFGEIEDSKPLGIVTYQTTAALREIKMRRLDMSADDKK